MQTSCNNVFISGLEFRNGVLMWFYWLIQEVTVPTRVNTVYHTEKLSENTAPVTKSAKSTK